MVLCDIENPAVTMSSLPHDSLPPDLARFVEDQVAQGKYPSTADVVCDGVRLLREREERLAVLRADIELGIGQLERREYTELESETDVDAFFEDVQTRAAERLRSKQDHA